MATVEIAVPILAGDMILQILGKTSLRYMQRFACIRTREI